MAKYQIMTEKKIEECMDCEAEFFRVLNQLTDFRALCVGEIRLTKAALALVEAVRPIYTNTLGGASDDE